MIRFENVTKRIAWAQWRWKIYAYANDLGYACPKQRPDPPQGNGVLARWIRRVISSRTQRRAEHSFSRARLVDFVADFAELGNHFRLPFRTYSSGMRSRLAFGVSMGIQFDTYLIDEVTSVGDASFQLRSRDLLKERTKNAGAIVVSHAMGMVRQLCTSGAVLENGKLTYFEDIEAAIAVHERNMAQ